MKPFIQNTQNDPDFNSYPFPLFMHTHNREWENFTVFPLFCIYRLDSSVFLVKRTIQFSEILYSMDHSTTMLKTNKQTKSFIHEGNINPGLLKSEKTYY